MKVGELLKLIPSETFADLAVETNVDFQVKKFSGEVMFKLCPGGVFVSITAQILNTLLRNPDMLYS
jgi:hypothetical protein